MSISSKLTSHKLLSYLRQPIHTNNHIYPLIKRVSPRVATITSAYLTPDNIHVRLRVIRCTHGFELDDNGLCTQAYQQWRALDPQSSVKQAQRFTSHLASLASELHIKRSTKAWFISLTSLTELNQASHQLIKFVLVYLYMIDYLKSLQAEN